MKKRNEGIDLLRCLAMLMVVVLHVLNHGGILESSARGMPVYNAAWLLRAAGTCAVNCYALISGYVGVKSHHRYRSIVPLWLQTAFYALLLGLLVPLFVPDTAKLPLLAMLAPVSHRTYWYFTAYAALFFLMPLLNKGLSALSRQEARRLVISILAVFCVAGMLPCFNMAGSFSKEDVFLLGEGYGVLWLILLYILGGCIRLHGFGQGIKARYLLAGYGVTVLAGWYFKLYMEQDAPQSLRPLVEENALLYYPSLTVTAAALCLLLLFSRMKQLPDRPARIVRWLTPSTFAVYLIHEHPTVRAGLMSGRFAGFAADAPLVMLIKTLLVSAGIFLAGILIDQLRLMLFRLLHLQQGLDWLADKLSPSDEAQA